MKKALLVLFLCASTSAVLIFAIGVLVLRKPSARAIEGLRSMEARSVVIQPGEVRGWIFEGGDGQGAVLLLHPLGGDRTDMLDRARFLHRAGFSVLAIDLQAHGLTPGRLASFGALESASAHAALTWLRARFPGQRIGALGISLGAAASLLGDQPLAADALVLERAYAEPESVVRARLAAYLPGVGMLASAVVRMQLAFRLGLEHNAVSPIRSVSRLHSPLLIIAAERDAAASAEDARGLFEVANDPKELWIVEGTSDEDLHRARREDYERRVLALFTSTLRAPARTSETAAG